MIGRKDDGGKRRFDLFEIGPLNSIVDVLTFGAGKYGDYNYRKVEKPQDRYYAAAMRHLTSWRAGEKMDGESKLPHLAHAAVCTIFLLWFEGQK